MYNNIVENLWEMECYAVKLNLSWTPWSPSVHFCALTGVCLGWNCQIPCRTGGYLVELEH